MNTEILDCGHPPTPDSGCGTGYGSDSAGKKSCYECCHKQELIDIEKTGKVFAYLTKKNGKHLITNWPGYLLSDNVVILSRSRDNFGGDRTYLRFRIDTSIYSGFGMGESMYLRAKLTKLTDLHARGFY